MGPIFSNPYGIYLGQPLWIPDGNELGVHIWVEYEYAHMGNTWGKSGLTHMGYIWVNQYGYQMGLSWAYPFGPSLVWVPSVLYGFTHMGPICFLGADALGPQMVFHMGPMFQRIWDPCGSHMGLLPGLLSSLSLIISLSHSLLLFCTFALRA